MMRLHFRPTLLVTIAVLAVAVPSAAVAEIPSVPSSHFQSSAGCGCHAALVEQWSGTMHSQALSDPIYQAKLAEANKATGGALDEFCEDCHGPVAAMAGMNGKGAKPRDAVANEGVGCDFCHQLTGTSKPIGNNSWIISADGVKRAQFKDSVSPSHDSAYSAYHESAEFCGACHNVDHPGNGMPLEATYTEWLSSSYAAQGITCQDCHMTPGAGPTKPNPGKAAAFGPDREHIYSMTFAGGNVALGNAELAEERLRGAATLEIDAPKVVEPGQDGTVTVTVTNSGAGHHLPTGLTDVRECWLAVTVAQADGTVLVEDRYDFNTVLKGADGKGPVQFWDAVGVLRDTRLPAGASKAFEYQVSMPDASEKVTVTAALYYRSCSEELAKKAGVDVPTTEMAKVEQAVFASEGAAVEGELGQSPEAATGGLILALGVGALIAVLVGFGLLARRGRAG